MCGGRGLASAACTVEELFGASDLTDLAGGFFAVDGAKSFDVIGVKLSFGGFTGGSGSVHGGGFVVAVIESEGMSRFVCDGILQIDGGDGSGDTGHAAAVEAKAIVTVVDLDIKAEDLAGATAIDDAGHCNSLSVVSPVVLAEEDDVLVFVGFVLVVARFCEVGKSHKIGLKAPTSRIHPRLEACFDRVVRAFEVGDVGATCFIDMVLDREFIPKERHFFAVGGGGFGANKGLRGLEGRGERDTKGNKSKKAKRVCHRQRPFDGRGHRARSCVAWIIHECLWIKSAMKSQASLTGGWLFSKRRQAFGGMN